MPLLALGAVSVFNLITRYVYEVHIICSVSIVELAVVQVRTCDSHWTLSVYSTSSHDKFTKYTSLLEIEEHGVYTAMHS